MFVQIYRYLLANDFSVLSTRIIENIAKPLRCKCIFRCYRNANEQYAFSTIRTKTRFRDKLDPVLGNYSRAYTKRHEINEEHLKFLQNENRNTQIYILGPESTQYFCINVEQTFNEKIRVYSSTYFGLACYVYFLYFIFII